MEAALHGHSTLGIPKSVAEKFVGPHHDDLERKGAVDERHDAPLNDREVAESIRDGAPSPQKFGDFWLFDLRITGTGAAYRDALDEWGIRNAEEWTSPEFVDRCNGLPVVFGHPERAGLDGQEFAERAIGTIVLPYRKGDEVWGIGKIFDSDAALLMQTTHRSTSPGVMPHKENQPTTLEDGTKVLAENLPFVLDHLAICEAGVWDKDGPPAGIRLDALSRKEDSVTEEEAKKLEKERDDAITRADAAEKERDDMKKRHDSEEEKAREDKRRHDAEETEREAVEAAEKEKADRKRKDARKKRHDGGKHDGMMDDCARCDSEEKEEEEAEKREDKGKKDAAPVENVNADIPKELKDARQDSARMKEQIERMETELRDMRKQPTLEDRDELAKAFHRADALYQMLGDSTPLAYPGESPLAYRKRLANGLRKYTEKYKDYALHDSVDPHAFDLLEADIYAQALEKGKNPVYADGEMILREVRRDENGKKVSRFYGDPRAAWTAFMPPVRTHITKINNAPAGR